MVTSQLLNSIPGLRHAFGNAAELIPAALAPVWAQRPAKRQVHGTRVEHVTCARQEIGDADGFFTSAPGIPVSIITADCVPLLLARRDGSQVGAIHAGWRGLQDNIIPAAIAAMAAAASAPALVAAVGPTICVDCYEVSEELADAFASRFGAAAVPRFRHLDLRAVAELQLQAAGVREIEHVGGCTCCRRDAAGAPFYRSYRRGDRGSQMHSGLYITPKGEK
ncbi:polyphenol oxidoreductase [Pseudoduganella sp. DS3]|uniref:Polyphenol oxidoreductase n=1 Tax=Pseudoduganella guangdongensis TaxID=2692179 RepID=A0A6N9HQU2_9BURK|nr:laccase domain-containing protein [Pseudoduganella guangdongensis]MYN05125.1 polyphenol oxidoreductase [Pseudoduganella guangdongensis]